MYGYFNYLIFLLPALLLGLFAQALVKSRFNKFSKIASRRGITGEQAARAVLSAGGARNVSVIRIAGNLTDNYNPKTNTISLSEGVYDSKSVAAIGVAAHEAGHAIQYAKGYAPIKLRAALISVTNLSSSLAIPLFFIGLIFASEALMLLGILLYAAIALFQLVTLPVEFNASARAMEVLSSSGMLDKNELASSKKVLSAAAMTYVAALLTSILTLLRLILLANRNRRN